MGNAPARASVPGSMKTRDTRHRTLWLGALLLLGCEAPVQATPEQSRVRAHLEGAFAQVAGAHPGGLDAGQTARRAAAIGWLREYIDAERYPVNDVSAARTPIFIDRFGNRCAMAALIERSGSGALAARISRQDNLARIWALRGDAELAGWLATHGLSLAEAARIQPSYDNVGVTTVHPTASVLASGLVGVTLPSAAGGGGFELLGGPAVRAGVRILHSTPGACNRCLYSSVAVMLEYARVFQLGYGSVNQLGLLGSIDLLDYGRESQLYLLLGALGAFDEARTPQLAAGGQAGLGFSWRGEQVPWFAEAVLGGLWQTRGVGLRLGLNFGFVW